MVLNSALVVAAVGYQVGLPGELFSGDFTKNRENTLPDLIPREDSVLIIVKLLKHVVDRVSFIC